MIEHQQKKSLSGWMSRRVQRQQIFCEIMKESAEKKISASQTTKNSCQPIQGRIHSLLCPEQEMKALADEKKDFKSFGSRCFCSFYLEKI